jgi:hypothetical protein
MASLITLTSASLIPSPLDAPPPIASPVASSPVFKILAKTSPEDAS